MRLAPSIHCGNIELLIHDVVEIDCGDTPLIDSRCYAAFPPKAKPEAA